MATKTNESLAKAFKILSLIDHNRPEITARIVVDELGLTLATAHRFLNTLVQLGALASYKRGSYCLGPRIWDLGRMEQLTNPLAQVVQPVIAAASEALNESVMASRLSRAGPICMAVARPNRPINIDVKVGAILPLHSTAQGKLWLASLSTRDRSARLAAYTLSATTPNTVQDRTILEEELRDIRTRGYAVNRGENEPDLGAVSVPVFDGQDLIVLSLSVFGLVTKFTDDFLDQAVSRLNEASHEIKQQMRRHVGVVA